MTIGEWPELALDYPEAKRWHDAILRNQRRKGA